MRVKEWVRTGCACLMAASMMMQPVIGLAQNGKDQDSKKNDWASDQKSFNDWDFDQKTFVKIAPKSSDDVYKYVHRVEDFPYLSHQQKLELLRKKIKYVFVLFQENRSFDFYFGTYPGARGLFSQPADKTPGFVQPIVLTNGSVGTISPFLISQSIVDKDGNTVLLYPEDTDSVNHGHTAIDAKLDLNSSNVAQNDRYAFTEEGISGGTLSTNGLTYTGPDPTEAQVQKGELVVSHVDCDTVPFLWQYADRFTLFDNFFDTVIGPSTPNAIAMIAGQSGLTQWVEHPSLALGGTGTYANGQLPVTGDPQPYWGNLADTVFQPTESGAAKTSTPASNLTFASLPLSFMGNQIETITASDLNPLDLMDIKDDIVKIAGDNNKPINWGWFQEGYDHESTDPTSTPTYKGYIAHHSGPQYFGYEADNAVETGRHLKGLGDFYTAISNNALPTQGGVFYVRGGYNNLDGLVPRSPSPAVKGAYPGNDDHPGYSDAQISEALLADSINAIASSKYWSESAIIITYDETDGLYDHTQPNIRSWDPLNAALEQGPRIPTIVISPYGVVHSISHEPTEHSSIIKFIDELYDLTPLADLPDEANARALGETIYGQKYMGPADDQTPGVGNLFSAFDNARLLGIEPPIPASFAEIPRSQVTTLPHYGAQGCRELHITPTDIVHGKVIDPAPQDFNPRPSTNPGTPYNGGWPSN